MTEEKKVKRRGGFRETKPDPVGKEKIMIQLEDMDHDQIIALTDEAIERMIDYMCADEGIRLIPRPIEPEKPEVKPDLEVYEWNDLVCEDRSKLEEFRSLFEKYRLEMRSTSYESSAGHEYKYLKPLEDYYAKDFAKIDTLYVFSISHYEESKLRLTRYKKEKDEYESDLDMYKEEQKKRDGISTELLNTIQAHRVLASKVETLTEEFERYLELAEGDGEIAMNFFKKAFPGENLWVQHQVRKKFDLVTEETVEPDINDYIEEVMSDD